MISDTVDFSDTHHENRLSVRSNPNFYIFVDIASLPKKPAFYESDNLQLGNPQTPT